MLKRKKLLCKYMCTYVPDFFLSEITWNSTIWLTVHVAASSHDNKTRGALIEVLRDCYGHFPPQPSGIQRYIFLRMFSFPQRLNMQTPLVLSHGCLEPLVRKLRLPLCFMFMPVSLFCVHLRSFLCLSHVWGIRTEATSLLSMFCCL